MVIEELTYRNIDVFIDYNTYVITYNIVLV